MVQNMRISHSGIINEHHAKIAKLTPLLKSKSEEKDDYLIKPSCCTIIDNNRCGCYIENVKNRIIIENSIILGSLYLRNH